jgi:oligopeptide/dipeptide ABC transporter ATP-binding protein
VMYEGKIVEYGEAEEVFNNAQHNYTRKLLEAIPHIEQCG